VRHATKRKNLEGQLQETVIVWNQKDDEIGKATRLQKRHRGMERRPLVLLGRSKRTLNPLPSRNIISGIGYDHAILMFGQISLIF